MSSLPERSSDCKDAADDLFTKLFIGILYHETASFRSWWAALGSDRFYSKHQILSFSSTENFSLPA
jgi:hypothetical protein